jgi:hypothetical protein
MPAILTQAFLLLLLVACVHSSYYTNENASSSSDSFYSLGGATLSPLGTSATSGPIVPAPDGGDENGAVERVRIGRRNQSIYRKPTPVPLSSSVTDVVLLFLVG